MADIVITAYRPKPGMAQALLDLAREHVPYLRAEGLATDRPYMICRSKDGTIVEIFEWATGGIAKAHEHPGVGLMWQRYGEVCDFVPLASLAEAQAMFAEFEPID